MGEVGEGRPARKSTQICREEEDPRPGAVEKDIENNYTTKLNVKRGMK